MTRTQGSATHRAEQGRIGFQIERSRLSIGGHGAFHRRQDGNDARLAALAGDAQRIGQGVVTAGQGQRLRHPQAAAIHQREHRRVPRRNPGRRAGLTGFAQQRFRRALADRAGQTARGFGRFDQPEGGIIQPPAPPGVGEEAARAGQIALDGARAGALAAPLGQKGAPVGRLQRRQIGKARQAGQMSGQKFDQPRQVPAIGLDRTRTGALLALKCDRKAASASGAGRPGSVSP